MKNIDVSKKLSLHVQKLRKCRLCAGMFLPVVSGGAVVSKVLLVGQAPGDKEPKLGRPFAWTAGKTLFRWFNEAAGMSEAQFRSSIYMAAVCRCFPGKNPTGGDRVPSPEEVLNCSLWLKRELDILRPDLVIPVGKLAIAQFLPLEKLDQMIGRKVKIVAKLGTKKPGSVLCFAEKPRTDPSFVFDVIALPHPSGASPWHRKEPGKSLLKKAMKLIVKHSAFKSIKPGTLLCFTEKPRSVPSFRKR